MATDWPTAGLLLSTAGWPLCVVGHGLATGVPIAAVRSLQVAHPCEFHRCIIPALRMAALCQHGVPEKKGTSVFLDWLALQMRFLATCHNRYCGVILSTVVPEKVVTPGRPEGPLVLILFIVGMMLSVVGAFGFGVMALVHLPMLISGATS